MFWPFRKLTPGASSRETQGKWPAFTRGKCALGCWTKPDGMLRVFLVANEDGTFTSWTEYFSEDPYEMCWVDCTPGASFFDCEETAIREIHAEYPWSKDVPMKRNPVE